MRGTFPRIFLQNYRCRDCRIRFTGLQRGVSFLIKCMAVSVVFMFVLSTVVVVLVTVSKQDKVASAGDDDFVKNLGRAEQGETEAQLIIGLNYLNGTGTREDHVKAIQWLERAVAQGNTDAMYNLGKFYFDPGHLRKHRDIQKGIELIRQAAEQEQVAAQYRLGMMYYKGAGILQDFEEGARWIRRAADHGMPEAMYQMGLLCISGRGVPVDNIQAYIWFNIAAARGKEEAVKQRELVAASLTIDQLSEAQLRSRTFNPAPGAGTSNGLMADRDAPGNVKREN